MSFILSFGKNRDIFSFPKVDQDLKLTLISDIAQRFIIDQGYKPFLCESEDEARARSDYLIKENKMAFSF